MYCTAALISVSDAAVARAEYERHDRDQQSEYDGIVRDPRLHA
jgi:hypothetical protein